MEEKSPVMFRVPKAKKTDFDVIIARLRKRQQEVLSELFTQFINDNKQYL